MKLTFAKSKFVLRHTRREEPDILGRVTAALAVLAWLVLAGDALAQGTNQWAPTEPGQPQPAPSGQVWGGTGGGGAVYAPADLDQQLANGTLKAPAAPASAPAVPQQPVYAPAGTATSRLSAPVAPNQAPAAPQQPYGAPLGAAPGAPAYGYPSQPYGQAYALPYLQPYAQPGYGGYGTPYYGVPGYPGATGPGFYPGVAPGLGGWGTPYSGPGGYGGVPFFGGSPFGFW